MRKATIVPPRWVEGKKVLALEAIPRPRRREWYAFATIAVLILGFLPIVVNKSVWLGQGDVQVFFRAGWAIWTGYPLYQVADHHGWTYHYPPTFALFMGFFANPLPFLLTAFLGAGFFAILYASSGGKKLGFGDVKLAFLLGLIFGYPLGYLVIVLGIWLAALVSIGLLIARRASRKDAIPLGSFLALASLLAIIFHHAFIPFITFFQ